MEYLGCYVCESPVLVLTTEYDGDDSFRWRVTCGNGHIWVATPGTQLTIDMSGVRDAEIPQIDP